MLNYFSAAMRSIIILLGLVLLITLNRCKKESPTITPAVTDVKFLGHKGGGNSLINGIHIENTLLSVQDGLKTLGGAEVDIQMSLDGTIWMFHNTDVGASTCRSNYHHSIVLLKDAEISQLQICCNNVQDRIYKLQELISVWNANSTGFILSMHLKLDFPSDTLNNQLIGGEAAYLSKFANSLAKIFPTVKHPDQLIIEVYDATFCGIVHSTIPGIKVCLIKEVTFQQQIHDALALGYDGVSCTFDEPTLTVSEVKRARDSGLFVELWTPDIKSDLISALNLQPNYIQTNNLDALNLLNVKAR
ncbi:MAG: glycerophosphodiester phosphodiesterase family protein [Mariniphaga sp.]